MNRREKYLPKTRDFLNDKLNGTVNAHRNRNRKYIL